MEPFFEQLGQTVLSRWKSENYSLEAFPGIASSALEERPLAKHADLSALIRDFLLDEEQPTQTDSPFGEPELVVFKHSRFYIQLLFWLEGTTAIHQHAFSGAFHVMAGSSLHAHYDFEVTRAVTPHLSVGNLRVTEMELLTCGRTVPIHSGSRTIHSLFHLDRPSVTVVVRTQHDPGSEAQFNYLPPHVAIDPLHADALMARRVQLLDVLELAGDADYVPMLMKLMGDLDFERAFYLLRHCIHYLQAGDEWTPVIQAFERKHGASAAGVGATLQEELRRERIRNFRNSITDSDHRFFLALLMNAPTREELLGLVKQKFPKRKPVAVILRWAEELLEITDEGASILDAGFPEELGTEIENQPAILIAAFGYFLNQCKAVPPTLEAFPAVDIDALRAAFGSSVLNLLTDAESF